LCVSFSVAAIVELLLLLEGVSLVSGDGYVPAMVSMSAGHEPLAVEHRGYDAPGEQVDRQQGCGEVGEVIILPPIGSSGHRTRGAADEVRARWECGV
jgi:hypothetical protein